MKYRVTADLLIDAPSQQTALEAAAVLMQWQDAWENGTLHGVEAEGRVDVKEVK